MATYNEYVFQIGFRPHNLNWYLDGLGNHFTEYSVLKVPGLRFFAHRYILLGPGVQVLTRDNAVRDYNLGSRVAFNAMQQMATDN